MTLNTTLDVLKRDEDNLKSIDMPMIFGTMEIVDVLFELDMYSDTTWHDVRHEKVVDQEYEVKTAKEASYEGLTEIEEAMVEAFLANTPLASPSRSSIFYITPNTEAQDYSITLGIDSPIDEETA